MGPRNKSRKCAVVSLAVNSDRPRAARDPSQGSVCLWAAAPAITRLADVHYVIYIIPPCASLCSPAVPAAPSHPPVLRRHIPDPVQPLPAVPAPWWQGGTGRTLLAWHLSTFRSLPLPRSVCHLPQKPAGSPACPRGHPSRASGWPRSLECPSQR